MTKYQKLHLATNTDALDLLAKRADIIRETRKLKFEKLCTLLDKQYKEAQLVLLDQERKYILLVRYLLLYEVMLEVEDNRFVELRFGAECNKARAQLEEIKNSLKIRYAQLLKRKASGSTGAPQAKITSHTAELETPKIFKDKFITCTQLFGALQKEKNILIIDARSEKDYLESRIDAPNIINVPEHCIASGLSANILGKKLSEQAQLVWEKRDSFKALVLLDWDTTADMFFSTKLDKLRASLVDWDLNRNYKEAPVVLNGGYMEFLETYPSFCHNPQVILSKRNKDLDELLDVENIVYPTESDNRAHVLGPAITPPPGANVEMLDKALNDLMVKENKTLTSDTQKVISRLLEKETEWKMLNHKLEIEIVDAKKQALIDQKEDIQSEITDLEKELEELNRRKEEINKTFELYAEFDPEEKVARARSDDINEIVKMEEEEKENRMILDMIAEDRRVALEKARAHKRKQDIPPIPFLGPYRPPSPTNIADDIRSYELTPSPPRDHHSSPSDDIRNYELTPSPPKNWEHYPSSTASAYSLWDKIGTKPFLAPFYQHGSKSSTEGIKGFLSPLPSADSIRNNEISAKPVTKYMGPDGTTITRDYEITPTPIIQKPLVNRDTKPEQVRFSRVVVGPIDKITPGRVGLRNIHNTCYMNTVIQCLRTLPPIRQFFCSGTYAKHVTKGSPALVSQTAYLVRILWSRVQKYIDPYEFYSKVRSESNIYGHGAHQDCMEFFLFLLNHLSEDCSYDIDRPHIMTPKQMAWFNQFEGKTSFFIDQFYHQIKIQQICDNCHTTTFKFEIESTFMLPVPQHDFYVETLMKEYMDDYIIPEYCCSKCRKPVLNRKTVCYEPRIIVLILKRYTQVFQGGCVAIKKTETKAYFPTTGFQLGNGRYNLNAVAMHIGGMDSGHYTAACLTQKGWFHFNDEQVVPIDVTEDRVREQAVAFFYTMCNQN